MEQRESLADNKKQKYRDKPVSPYKSVKIQTKELDKLKAIQESENFKLTNQNVFPQNNIPLDKFRRPQPY